MDKDKPLPAEFWNLLGLDFAPADPVARLRSCLDLERQSHLRVVKERDELIDRLDKVRAQRAEQVQLVGALTVENGRLRAELAKEEDERDALKLASEEGQEIIAELSVALAVLTGDTLTTCDTNGPDCRCACPGHLSLKAGKVVEHALAAYRTLQEGNRAAVERVREVELLLDTVREEAAKAPSALAVLLGKHRAGEDAGPPDTLRRLIREHQELTNLKNLHRAVLKPLEAEMIDCENLEETLARIIRERDWFEIEYKRTYTLSQDNFACYKDMKARAERVESDNRSKCSELAEKAGEIRELRDWVVEKDREIQRLRGEVSLYRVGPDRDLRAEVQQQRLDRAVIANHLENLLEFTKREADSGAAAKLLALLDSEEPPQSFADAAYGGGGGMVADAWRWLREQVHGTGKEG